MQTSLFVALLAMIVMVSGSGPSEEQLENAVVDAIAAASAGGARGPHGPPARSQQRLGAVHRSKPKTVKLSKSAVILERLAQNLMSSPQHYSLDLLSGVDSPYLARICDDTSMMSDTCFRRANREFRSADGSCNNLIYRLWGSTGQCFIRELKPQYDDGFNKPRSTGKNGPLPSAKLVSDVLHEDINRPSPDTTHMVMQWGQFLDHDITLTPSFGEDENFHCTCDSDDDRCFNIDVPPEKRELAGERCIPFARSLPCPNWGCRIGPRQQVNQITAFVDASNVYGSSDEEMEALRVRGGPLSNGARGLLKSRPNPDRQKKEFLPEAMSEEFECASDTGTETCSQTGDIRVNEQPGLTSMHMVFLREHNWIAGVLSFLNGHWKDDRVFYETRKIIGALMQKITYDEFLPAVLGSDFMTNFSLSLLQRDFFTGYDRKVNPGISNAFATAVYRFGHSLINNLFNRFKAGQQAPIELTHGFFNASHIFDTYQGGPDSILRGLTDQPNQQCDRFIVKAVTKHLFADPPGSAGLDLAALNIQRGRDHGLPGYNEWRVKSGLQRATVFQDLSSEITDATTLGKLESLYGHVDDIDLFPGGLSETPMPGAIVGETFAHIIAEQFRRLKFGDRFWHENKRQFTPDQLKEIRKTSLARILCDNTDGTTDMQPDVFRQPGQGNEVAACSGLPQMDLSPWKETFRGQ